VQAPGERGAHPRVGASEARVDLRHPVSQVEAVETASKRLEPPVPTHQRGACALGEFGRQLREMAPPHGEAASESGEAPLSGTAAGAGAFFCCASAGTPVRANPNARTAADKFRERLFIPILLDFRR
jgi:hypothetical protein